MTRPRFSVVTVTLNCADAAEATVRSVLAQTYPGVEQIVKDGGSRDGTPERLGALGANVVVSADSGIYDAMNQALALCTGEYVYFLNAGDTFATPTVLAELAERIEPAAAVVYAELLLHPMMWRTSHPDTLSRYYLFRKNMNHQAWMARLETYRAFGGLDTRYAFCADQDFIWRARFRERLRFQHVDLTLAHFVYGGASTTAGNRARVDRERWQLLHKYFQPWEIAVYGAASLYFLNPLKVKLRRMQLAAQGISY
ncbi:MAG: glycosyltransferase [Chloroflexales bacterium]|nr:glycosyltransferase [Chloroflexales bacterium]